MDSEVPSGARGLGLPAPPPLGAGEGLEVELMMDHSLWDEAPLNIHKVWGRRASRWANMPPNPGTELRTFPDPAPRACPSDRSCPVCRPSSCNEPVNVSSISPSSVSK